MNLSDWLLVSHLVGDSLLQANRLAHNKAQSWRRMLRHVGTFVVMVSVVPVTCGMRHNLPARAVVCAILFLFGTHVLLDRRHVTLRWVRRIGMTLESPWL